MNDKKLKPVTFVSGRCLYHNNNHSQQIMLLNALKITQDPNKLKQMIGVRTVADVFRTLDKMAMRKEYHEALSREGISFDWLVQKTKAEINNQSGKASDRINAIKLIMKSLGLDNYQQEGIGGGSWEDILLKATEKDKKELENKETNLIEEPKVIEVYEVTQPEMPESLKKKKDKEKVIGKSLYE